MEVSFTLCRREICIAVLCYREKSLVLICYLISSTDDRERKHERLRNRERKKKVGITISTDPLIRELAD